MKLYNQLQAPRRYGLDGDTPVLTIAGIRDLVNEYVEERRARKTLMRQAQEHEQRSDRVWKKIDAARLFAPDSMNFDALITEAAKAVLEIDSGTIQTRDGQPTWTATIERILNEADRGLTHPQLMVEIRKTPLAEKSTKSFYGAIAKLADRKLLIKHGGLLYTAKVAENLISKGEFAPDDAVHQTANGNSASAHVLKALDAHRKGLTGPELRSMISKEDDAPASIRAHGQYLYNVLSKLKRSGKIKKVEKRYVLVVEDKGGNGAADNNPATVANASI